MTTKVTHFLDNRLEKRNFAMFFTAMLSYRFIVTVVGVRSGRKKHV